MSPAGKFRTALVLSGGGTRGAYEAGVVHYIRTKLSQSLRRDLPLDILCGSSVGAINCAFMAAMADKPDLQGHQIHHLWQNIRTENIYRRGPGSLGRLLLRSALGVGARMAGIRGFVRPADEALLFRGFFDTEPFFHFLKMSLPWPRIHRNLKSGTLDALAISATNMLTGNLEIFLQRNPNLLFRSHLRMRDVRISPRHVMASAAIPILFPPVPIHNIYYNDGGIRLNTPLAPAVSLGAARILIIGTRQRGVAADQFSQTTEIRRPASPPTLGDVFAKFLTSLLIDRVEADHEQVERINRILSAVENRISGELYETVCNDAGVQRIRTLAILPSVPIETLVDDTIHGSYRKLESVGVLEKFILRLLESDPKRGNELLSYFLFEPRYLRTLISMGFEDAGARHDELMAFAEEAIRSRERA